jgi:hypothetical protein
MSFFVWLVLQSLNMYLLVANLLIRVRRDWGDRVRWQVGGRYARESGSTGARDAKCHRSSGIFVVGLSCFVGDDVRLLDFCRFLFGLSLLLG